MMFRKVEERDAVKAGTVLLAEDEPSLRSLIERMLTGAGYEVLQARNGIEALRQSEARDVDLVITDVHMPYVDGLSLVQQLAAQAAPPRCLVMSAHDLQRALPAGAVFLKKPFTREDLLQQVRRLTEPGSRTGHG